MDVTVISSTDLRVKARDVMEDAKFKNRHFIVETFGKPMVAIIGIDEYNELMKLKEQSCNPQKKTEHDKSTSL